jgi:hypothetical protein
MKTKPRVNEVTNQTSERSLFILLYRLLQIVYR